MKNVLIAFAVLAAIPAAAETARPYAGLETRDIKALAPDRIEALLEGRGLSYALAAELNGLPGPRHALDLREDLNLDVDQVARLAAIFDRMQADAIPLRRAIVATESELDRAFASGTDPVTVSALTARIAALDGELRAVHLNAHLATAPLLTAQQRLMYGKARGYRAQTSGDRLGGAHGGHGN